MDPDMPGVGFVRSETGSLMLETVFWGASDILILSDLRSTEILSLHVKSYGLQHLMTKDAEDEPSRSGGGNASFHPFLHR